LFSETACGLGPYCQGEAESERSGFWELKKGVYFANNKSVGSEREEASTS
jgi:hypothetical protein